MGRVGNGCGRLPNRLLWQPGFDGAPDYEMPGDSGGDNVYEVSVDAKDADFTSSLTVTVTVNDVNEAPTVTGSQTPSFPENKTGSVATYRATDPERRDTITWSVSGTDDGDFEISQTGVLTFANTPDLDNPEDPTRTTSTW